MDSILNTAQVLAQKNLRIVTTLTIMLNHKCLLNKDFSTPTTCQIFTLQEISIYSLGTRHSVEKSNCILRISSQQPQLPQSDLNDRLN